MKPWIKTEIHNHCDQTIILQPTPEFDGVELYFCEAAKSHMTNALYIDKDELPVLIKKLQEMMEYVTTK